MQEKDEVLKIQEKYPYVKLIFGTHNIDEFSAYIEEVLTTNKKLVKVFDEAQNVEKLLPTKRVYNFKCGINIMFGCNNFCTYCIVPYVRGRERSRDVDIIVSEIKKCVSDGVIEVMLLGQNVNSYKGKASNGFSFNNNEEVTFSELLNEVCKIDGLERVRFMTSHPKDLSVDLINVIKNNKKVCRHIHLPIQSGSDVILEKMNRHYDRKRYLEIVNKIRNEIEDVAITTDIIVGFPGETEKDFDDTISIIKEVGYDAVFTFEYSKRTGTKAASMDNQVPESIVKERFKRLLKVVEECSGVNTKKYEGRVGGYTRIVKLGQRRGDKEKGKLTGRLSNNYLVHFEGNENLIGKIVNVKLVRSKGFYFEGEYIDK